MRKPALALLAVAALLALPAAQAHVTITATTPKDPLVPGVAVTIPVTASANCAVVLAEYNAMGKTSLHWGLAPDAAKYWSAKSEDVAFDGTTCDATSATVTIQGTIAVTPSLDAPALTPLGLTITAYNGASTTPEGGTPASFNVTVAYRANATLAIATPVRNAGPDGSVSYTLPLTLTYATNAPATLEFSAGSPIGTHVGLPATATLDPPAFTNKTVLVRHVEATFFRQAGNGSAAQVNVNAVLRAKGAALPPLALTQWVSIPAEAAPAPASSSTSKASPAPSIALALSLLGVALLRRKR